MNSMKTKNGHKDTEYHYKEVRKWQNELLLFLITNNGKQILR